MKKVRCISPHGGPLGAIDNGILGRVAVGAVVDAPDDFEPDGFHFELAAEPPPPPASGGGLADLLSKGEN